VDNKDDSKVQKKRNGGKPTDAVKSESVSTVKPPVIPATASSGVDKAETPKRKPSPKKEAAPEKEPVPVEKESGGGALVKTLLVLCLLLLLAIAGAAGWWFYQFQQQEPTINENVAIQENVASQEAAIQRLEQRLDDERRERQQQHVELNQTVQGFQLKVNSHARRLRELSTTSRSDWLLAEAEYLIRLANQRLITERNTKNAITLLVTADSILRDLDEVDLLAVRRALAKSITALRSTAMVDREGLYLQLGALSDQLVKLPLIAIEVEVDKPVVADVDTTTVSDGWKDQLLHGFQSALDSAGELIRVQRRDVPLTPLPSAEEDQRLRHSLAIMLEQAQMALLREEQVIYQTSLEKAQQWLNNKFELNDAVLPLVDQLTQLAQQDVTQELPDISEGLEVLRDYIDSRHKRHTIQASEETPEGDQQ
jgi:uroporphyrin-3 C-methyltransferase